MGPARMIFICFTDKFYVREKHSSPGEEAESLSAKRRKPSRILRFIRFGIGQIFRLIATVFLICVITGCIVATSMVIYVMNFMETDNNVNLDNVNLSFTTMFYADDENGQPEEVYRMSGDQNRIEVSITEIPDILIEAYVATEDKRFWEHEGVDWIRTVGVSIREITGTNVAKGGGSTITQQVIKNVTKDDDVTPVRKLREIFRALELERNYSKEEILESYLNIIFLGKNIYGVEAACQYYFGCSVGDITIPQAATLAGMTTSPNYRRPDLHPDRAKERRDYALKCMMESGYITEAEYNKYCAMPVVTVDRSNTDSEEEQNGAQAAGVTSYFTDMVIEDVLNDLMQANGWSRSYANYMLRNGGYRIYMTEDQQLQNYLEEKYNDPRTFSAYDIAPNEDGKLPESAFVIMNYDGEVVAVVGGKGEKTETLSFNRATMSKRPPGSSIKPLAVYGPALEYDVINWSSVINDSPAMKIKDGKGEEKDWPSNYEKDYRGDMTVVEALRISRNTIPVKLILQLTTERSVNFLEKKLGISTLVTSGSANDYGPSLAIGSMTDGVYLRELTAAYLPFGNGGVYYSPVSYTRIEDASGNVVLDNTPKKTRAFSEDTASIMNRLLKVVTTEGTGRESNIGAIPVVGKTGTTQDYYDMSFVGLTPYYVAGVWTGYDIPEMLPWQNMYDTDTIWSNVMGAVHEGLEVKDFELSENIVQMEYCTYSGMAAGDDCPEKKKGYYKVNAKPEICDSLHLAKPDSKEEGKEENGEEESSGPSFTTKPGLPASPEEAEDAE